MVSMGKRGRVGATSACWASGFRTGTCFRAILIGCTEVGGLLVMGFEEVTRLGAVWATEDLSSPDAGACVTSDVPKVIRGDESVR